MDENKKKTGPKAGPGGKRVGIDIYVPIMTLIEVDKRAADDQTSRSELYNKAMEEYLKNHKK